MVMKKVQFCDGFKALLIMGVIEYYLLLKQVFMLTQ